jgi:hypothetical protein
MTNEQKRDLCLALMRADSEAEVIRVLTEAIGVFSSDRA